MKQTTTHLLRALRILAASVVVGSVFGGSCIGLGNLQSVGGSLIRSINPCGTILDCNPLEFDLLFNDVTTPDFNECPISVLPQDCVGVFPPTDPGAGGGAGAGGIGG